MTSAAYVASTIQRTGSTAPHRSGHTALAANQSRPTVTDDYERWYTEGTPNNRMLLALRSGIDSEISWALDRLTRLCNNEQFVLRAIPGLTDALFEWPVWYVEIGATLCAGATTLFSLPQEWERKRKHALESILILRNAAVNEPNAQELSEHRRTRSLILLALHGIKPECDANTEFVLYVVELLQAISAGLSLPPPDAPALAIPVQPLQEIAGKSSNRALILSAMTTLNLLLSNPANVAHLVEDSPALGAALRYLPLFTDKPLVDASVNYLYTHLSHPAMTKAFLLHPQMPATLRLLVSLLLSEQAEETVTLDIGPPVHTAPSSFTTVKDHELSPEELNRLVPMPEPQRCYEWMRTMFVAKADGELTQVEFWNLYKDAFTPYTPQHPMLAASDVIKNVSLVFAPAQAMFLPGTPQRFIVHGVDRRKERLAVEQQFKCLWNRSQCPTLTFGSTAELYEHIVHQHIDLHKGSEATCSWATCSHGPLSKALLRGHVLTHLPSSQSAPRDPGQTDNVSLPSEHSPHPTSNPTERPPPPPRSAKLTYTRPVADPPSTSLTALLCIRVLFRASFASSDAAPRADDDHFGFPGIVEETEDTEGLLARSAGNEREREGERRGRKAFIGIRHMLESVQIKDEALMGWITEMIDAGIISRATLPQSLLVFISHCYNEFGIPQNKIAPHQGAARFWSDLFELAVDSAFLSATLTELIKESCLGPVKPSLNAIVLACLQFARAGQGDDPRRPHAIHTLSIISKCMLRKNLTGWEVMEIFAGGVNESDKVFGDMTAMIEETLGDSSIPVDLRHQVLQLAVILMSGISQLSPGAYFLRRDLFPSIVAIITTPETEQFTFEAAVLLALLANFHKSEAAKLNPYLKRMRETQDEQLMRKLCWASNFAVDAVVRAYQNISDDSPSSLSATFGSLLSSMRPDRALSSTPTDLPRELFKDQPIEACVILLPIFEFLHVNERFHTTLLKPLTTEIEPPSPTRISPLPYTLLTLASYLLTHASSVHAPRAIGYAHLSLNILLVMAESKVIMGAFCNRGDADIRLCRQRPPLLPNPGPRMPICAILDCCVLWLRHNLHKRLEVHSYLVCTRICYHVLWYVQRERIRLDYHWPELWSALIGLLDFLVNKLDSLLTTGGVEQLIQETLMILGLALCHAGALLQNPTAIHELVYEVVRSSEVLKRLQIILDELALPASTSRRRPSIPTHSSPDALTNILTVAIHYEAKIREAKATSARSALRAVAKEVDRDGLTYGKNLHVDEPPRQAEDVVGMVRYAYRDAMSLMP